MSNYTETFTSTNGSTVDAVELETQFDAIATAIATKLDSDGSGTLTGNLSMGSNRITGVSDPTADQDAATKIYVDEAEVSGFAAVSTTTITTSEVSEDQISITIPSGWNGYYVEAIGHCYLNETTAMSGVAQITLRIREGAGTGGTALAAITQGMGEVQPENVMALSLMGFLEGQTTTGSITFTLTSIANAESGRVSMSNMRWRVRARRTS